MDAEAHITKKTAGNGLVTTRSFSATTGRLASIGTGNNNTVQNFVHTYDLRGRQSEGTDRQLVCDLPVVPCSGSSLL
jgi:hypothetical protein